MKILVPSPSYETVLEEVLQSIRIQGVELELIDCTFDESIHKRKRIAMAKEKCRQIGLASGCEYVVLNDSDLVHIRTDNFDVARKVLEGDKNIGAVSFRREKAVIPERFYDAKTNNHICSGVIMFSRAGLEKVRFDVFDMRPTCFSIGASLSENNLKYCYVDSVERIKVLRRDNING